jgi:hypothetical protein
MSQARIRNLFDTRVREWTLSRRTQIPIVVQNVGSSVPNTLHIQLFMLPAPTLSADLEGKHRSYNGAYQINIVTRLGAGPGETDRLVEELEALFPVNLRLTIDQPEFAVQVMTPFSPRPPVPEPDRYTVPGFFTYRSDLIIQ